MNCRITGIETSVDPTDKILIASSAVIPIFAFYDWIYSNINEILLYPSMFNRKFDTEGAERAILGMVGNGYMEGKMILFRPALKHGFKNESDKKNTAIHEFVHLINKKIDEIYEGESDINPYGGTNRAEFFSVVSEYWP